jgi:hypothetical protein
MSVARAAAVSWLAVTLSSCSHTGLEGGVYRGDGFAFRLQPPDGGWTRVDHSQAALAYRNEGRRASILINARCGVDGDDVPLVALTNHLFIDFTDRNVAAQEVVPFDGREAMHTTMSAKLDGVPMSYDVWVFKKNGCVYDLLLVAPGATFAESRPAFRSMVESFATVSADDG